MTIDGYNMVNFGQNRHFCTKSRANRAGGIVTRKMGIVRVDRYMEESSTCHAQNDEESLIRITSRFSRSQHLNEDFHS